MELASCQLSDAKNLEVAPRGLENLRTPFLILSKWIEAVRF
jgi:hypothetical protein